MSGHVCFFQMSLDEQEDFHADVDDYVYTSDEAFPSLINKEPGEVSTQEQQNSATGDNEICISKLYSLSLLIVEKRSGRQKRCSCGGYNGGGSGYAYGGQGTGYAYGRQKKSIFPKLTAPGAARSNEELPESENGDRQYESRRQSSRDVSMHKRCAAMGHAQQYKQSWRRFSKRSCYGGGYNGGMMGGNSGMMGSGGCGGCSAGGMNGGQSKRNAKRSSCSVNAGYGHVASQYNAWSGRLRRH
uniref:Uncharacterized protein n=1 Tax=Romanomermis culicivorax TaxID=13658 RepID=A0A915IPB8_ROMCU